MRTLIWRRKALDRLDEIVAYIGERNSAAAEKMQALFETGGERALRNPFVYRRGRVEGTREIVLHPNYILIYRVNDDTVEILNLIHARQQYP